METERDRVTAKMRAIDLEKGWGLIGQCWTKRGYGIHRSTWMEESEETVSLLETRIRSL